MHKIIPLLTAVTIFVTIGPLKTEVPHTSDEINTQSNAIQLAEDNEPQILPLYLAEDGSLIYSQFESDYTATYYRYYPDRMKKIKIGEIPSYYVGTTDISRMNNTLFFYVGIFKNENNSENILYGIDLDSNSLLKYEETSDTESLPGISAYCLDDAVVTLKNVVEADASIRTFFEFYDIESGAQQKKDEKHWYSYDENGTAIFGFCTSDGYLYSLQDEYIDNGNIVQCKLIQYDTSMEICNTILLDGDILNFIRSGRVNKISIHDDYIFLSNISSYGFLGKIEDNKIIPILNNTHYLQMVPTQPSDDSMFFYERRSNILYSLNKGCLEKIELDFDEGISLRSILINGDSVYINCYVQDENKKILPEISYFMLDKPAASQFQIKAPN